MPYQSGEDGFLRNLDSEKEQSPVDRFRHLRAHLTTRQNRLPNVSIEQPPGVLYYNEDHLGPLKDELAEMERLHQEGLSQFEDTDGVIKTADVIKQVRANIDFSEKVHKLPVQDQVPSLSEDGAREAIKKMLLGGKL